MREAQVLRLGFDKNAGTDLGIYALAESDVFP